MLWELPTSRSTPAKVDVRPRARRAGRGEWAWPGICVLAHHEFESFTAALRRRSLVARSGTVGGRITETALLDRNFDGRAHGDLFLEGRGRLCSAGEERRRGIGRDLHEPHAVRSSDLVLTYFLLRFLIGFKCCATELVGFRHAFGSTADPRGWIVRLGNHGRWLMIEVRLVGRR